MKPNPSTLLVLSIAVLSLSLGGCNPSAKPVEPGSGSGTGTAGKDGKGEGSGSSTPTVESISAELKHDAFAYNGFEGNKKLTYLFSQYKGETPEAGSQISELKSASPTAAAFAVKRSGSMDKLGDEEWEIRPDGIYLISTEQGSPAKPVRLMPSVVHVGTEWNYDYVLTTPTGQATNFKGKAKALQEVKLKVKAGEFDTMLVSDTAVMDKGGTKGTVSGKTWYAKGIGVVQMKVELKDNTGKIVSSTIELSEIGDK